MRRLLFFGLLLALANAASATPYMTIFVPKYMSVTCTADLCKCLAASQEGYETLAVQFCTNVIETGDAKYRVTAYLIRARANILKRDYDHAIVDATQAIATKSDIPDDLPAAYILRGQTYEEMGNFDKALADYDAALGVDANTFGAYAWRSSVYVLTGKYDLALADDAMGLKLKPDFEGSYLDRGYDYFAQGRFADAASDFEKARSLNPPDPVAVLWLHLANLHQGTDDGVQFAANSAKVKLDEWPGQTVKLFMEQATPHDVDVAIHAKDQYDYDSYDRECDGTFAKAEWYGVWRHDNESAQRLYRHYTDVCPVALDYLLSKNALKAKP